MVKFRQTIALWAAAFLLAAVPEPASAMDQVAYEAAQATLASALYDLEGNLIEQEAIEMNAKSLAPKGDSIQARYADYNQRIQQHNSYCQGTFEEPEYSRRLAQCNAEEAQIGELVRQLDIERDAFQAQLAEIQARDTRRQQAAQPMLKRLEGGVIQLITACMTMTLEEQARLCRIPAAPGPRTAPMVAEMNAVLRSEIVKLSQ